MLRLALALAVLLVAPVTAEQGQATRTSPPASEDFVGPGDVEALPAPLQGALAGLRAPALASHIAFLSAPSLEGRGLGGRGLEATAEYVAASLALAGVPAFDPTGSANPSAPYFQQVPLLEVRRAAGRITVETRRGNRVEQHTFQSGVDCLFPELPPGVFSGPVVLAGYGIRETSPARDDYAGLDVQGRIVLIRAGLPPGAEWQTPALEARYGAEGVRQRYAAKLALAASLGARAVLAIEGGDFPGRLAAAGPPAPFFVLPRAEEALPPVVRVSARVGEAMLASATTGSGAGRHGVLAGVSATVRVTGEERVVVSRNVLGVIRGADPRLSQEAVVIGAHMDHLGQAGDKYYPGADDNASGVAALLEMARAFAALSAKPRRTLIFAFWTGEEAGHLGSEHYVRAPLWPLERTSVYVNLDMIGHPWTGDEIRRLVSDVGLDGGQQFAATVKATEFVELGMADWAPELAPVLKRAARGTGLALHLDRTDGTSGGSDYREFARRGLPWVRFFGNYFAGYHEPGDTIETLDPGQVLRMARLAFASAWLLAQQ